MLHCNSRKIWDRQVTVTQERSGTD